MTTMCHGPPSASERGSLNSRLTSDGGSDSTAVCQAATALQNAGSTPGNGSKSRNKKHAARAGKLHKTRRQAIIHASGCVVRGAIHMIVSRNAPTATTTRISGQSSR